MSEEALVIKTINFLRSFGFRIKREVPSMGARIDIVGLNLQNDVFAIEAKISAVKRVLEQCRGHELVADYICVAWGNRIVSDNMFSLCEEKGYGIIHYNSLGACEWVLKPLRQRVWKPQRQVLLENFEAS